MKKIFLFLALCLGLSVNAQNITCNGTYVMTEPNDGLKLKECCICINDTQVELLIFDENVVVPVLETETVDKENVSGKVWYLDNERLSYVFYGTSNNNGLCIVSVISHDGRYTFAKTFSDNLGMKNY